jgi:glycosyltransferase involved in cell wall biosynthesis
MKNVNTLLYLGLNGFPSRDAGIQRQLQLSKAIINDKTRVLVINRKGVHSDKIIDEASIKISGIYEGVEYVYTSGTPKYNNNSILRNLLKLRGFVVELYLIIINRFFNNVSHALVKTDSLIQLKYYFFLSRILRFKLIFDYLEFRSSVKKRGSKEISDKKSFDFEFYKYVDYVIVISHYLANHVKKLAPGIPYIIIPPIIDFEKFKKNTFIPTESDYFLYCGSIAYADIMEFIIDAYQQSKARDKGVSLVIIATGDQERISMLQEHTKQNPLIKVLSYQPYEHLIGYYKSAKALLIPLTDNLQDRARFPFKVSEYTAAARPIISSDSGAMINYFQDGINALLAKTDDLSDFKSKLNFVLDNPEQAEKIGLKGHETGRLHFNYQSYSLEKWNNIF